MVLPKRIAVTGHEVPVPVADFTRGRVGPVLLPLGSKPVRRAREHRAAGRPLRRIGLAPFVQSTTDSTINRRHPGGGRVGYPHSEGLEPR